VDRPYADAVEAADFERLGVYDPAAPDAADRLRLLRDLLDQGARPEDLVAATEAGTLGGLALELTLRGETTTRPFAEAVTEAGLSTAEAADVWSALGFPTPGDDVPRLTPEEVDALSLLAGAGHDLLGEDAILGLVRVIGSSTARLAQAVVDAFRVQFEMPRRTTGTGYAEIVAEYSELVDEELPAFLDAVGAVFLRHLIAAASRSWLFDPESSSAGRDLTVGFVDLVDYTGLSRTLTVRALEQLVNRFETVLDRVLSRHDGQVVKLLGDGAMFVAADATGACRTAVELLTELAGEDGVPPARVGLAAGRVVSLHGDYFGDVVNLASRLVGLAGPETVVVSDDVRRRVVDQLGQPAGGDAGHRTGDDLSFEPLPPSTLKGFEVPTVAYRLVVD
jgi:adenylate cyclase